MFKKSPSFLYSRPGISSPRASEIFLFRTIFQARSFVTNKRLLDNFLNNQPDALIIQIYSVIKFYMFRTNTLPIIRSSLLYIRHWFHAGF